MPIYKGDSNGKAIDCGAPGRKMLIGFKGKARRVGQIMFGDDQGIARLAYAGQGYREDDPYLLTCGDDFKRMGKEPYAFYRLANDIDITEYTFTGSRFYGVLDGAGYRLSYNTNENASLIQENYGVVKNIAYYGSQTEKANSSNKIWRNRSLVGHNWGVVQCCSNEVEMMNTHLLVENNVGVINNCLAYAFSSNSTASQQVSPLLLVPWYENSSVTNCVVYAGPVKSGTYYMNAFGNFGNSVDPASYKNCYYGKKPSTNKAATIYPLQYWTTKPQSVRNQYVFTELNSTDPVTEQCDLDFDSTWEVTADGYLKLQGLKAI